jgi:hypothetical protein
MAGRCSDYPIKVGYSSVKVSLGPSDPAAILVSINQSGIDCYRAVTVSERAIKISFLDPSEATIAIGRGCKRIDESDFSLG